MEEWELLYSLPLKEVNWKHRCMKSKISIRMKWASTELTICASIHSIIKIHFQLAFYTDFCADETSYQCKSTIHSTLNGIVKGKQHKSIKN